jgi:hypothetical protein
MMARAQTRGQRDEDHASGRPATLGSRAASKGTPPERTGGQYLDAGEAAVVRPLAAGFEVVAHLGLKEWREHGLGALGDLVHVGSATAGQVIDARPTGDEAADLHVLLATLD